MCNIILLKIWLKRKERKTYFGKKWELSKVFTSLNVIVIELFLLLNDHKTYKQSTPSIAQRPTRLKQSHTAWRQPMRQSMAWNWSCNGCYFYSKTRSYTSKLKSIYPIFLNLNGEPYNNLPQYEALETNTFSRSSSSSKQHKFQM